MILIQVNEWLGPSKSALSKPDRTEARERLTAFASRLALEDALMELEAYEEEYRMKYSETAVNFRVIGIQEIPDLSDEALAAGRIEVIEDESRRLRAERTGENAV